MKIILLQNQRNLGKKGDVLNVRDGYAKNFLIPQEIAVLAESKKVQKILQAIKMEKNTKKTINEKIKKSLQKIDKLLIQSKASEQGKLASSITQKKIQNFIYTQYKIKLANKFIKLPAKKIKKIGQYKIQIAQKDIILEIKNQKDDSKK